jgi:hypothetical protein
MPFEYLRKEEGFHLAMKSTRKAGIFLMFNGAVVALLWLWTLYSVVEEPAMLSNAKKALAIVVLVLLGIMTYTFFLSGYKILSVQSGGESDPTSTDYLDKEG